MSKHKAIVMSVVEAGLTKAEAARQYGVSWRWVHTLVSRYQAEGLDGLEPRSRRPHSNPSITHPDVRARIIGLRCTLADDGMDAGPATIAWHLQTEGIDPPPAISTIRRIITDAHLVTPEPKKRPKSSLHRFEAAQPNETWQSDFTHWTSPTAPTPRSWPGSTTTPATCCPAPRTRWSPAPTSFDTSTTAINSYGPPASTLTDNGTVYTTRLLRDTTARNAFEYLIAALGITQKNGKPYHPQTQGKIERFWQTLKRWLATKPRPVTIGELQQLLDRFTKLYNNARPHRSIGRQTPSQAYTARPKAHPASTPAAGFHRVRFDHVGTNGKVSLRRAGRMHHLGIGAAHARKPVVLIITEDTVTVVHHGTGKILATNTIDPTRTYWRNNNKEPGRWPNSTPQHEQ